jgi:hypothetical protein
MRIGQALLLVAATSMGSANALAADEWLPQSVEACAQEIDNLSRLTCFDRTAARLKASRPPAIAGSTPAPAPAPTPGAGPATPPLVAPASAQSADQQFGAEAIAERQAKKERAQDGALQALVAKVARVSHLPEGNAVLELDNGQRWQQVEAKTFVIAVGDRVTITRGALRSYWLETDAKRGTRVHRIH